MILGSTVAELHSDSDSPEESIKRKRKRPNETQNESSGKRHRRNIPPIDEYTTATSSVDLVYDEASRSASLVPTKTTTPSTIALSLNAKNATELLIPFRQRTRLALPITFNIERSPATVLAYADSGADHNAMTLKYAKTLGLKVDSISTESPFKMANSKIINPIGMVSTTCGFGKDGLDENNQSLSMLCSIFVFNTLATPLIMGLAFLQATGTLTQFRHRMIEVAIPRLNRFRIMSMGSSRPSVVCQLHEEIVVARVDSGSDFDVISLEFALRAGFSIDPSYVAIVEFADGSDGELLGLVTVPITIGEIIPSETATYLPRNQELTVQFYVLENLACDVLIGHGTERRLNIFTQYGHLLVEGDAQCGVSEFMTLRHIGAKERKGLKMLNLSRRWVHTLLGTGPNNSGPLGPGKSNLTYVKD